MINKNKVIKIILIILIMIVNLTILNSLYIIKNKLYYNYN